MSKLRIYHTDYGCDSGCCGHAVETEPGDPIKFEFQFAHCYDNSPEGKRAFAEEMVGAENVDDVDFETSEFIED